jgi:hypothetical protein
MSDPTLPRALSQLDLPPAALHYDAHAEPHPDSEDAVQYERQRFSKELVPVRRKRITTPDEAHATHSFASLRSRNTSARSSTRESRENLRLRTSDVDGASIHMDLSEDRDERADEGRTEWWYDAVGKFWARHVSLSIDEGAHRDHLGAIPFFHSLDQSIR